MVIILAVAIVVLEGVERRLDVARDELRVRLAGSRGGWINDDTGATPEPAGNVHLHREAVGEWILLDASTTISAGGAGLASAMLSDREGPVGTGAQSLLITRRSPAT